MYPSMQLCRLPLAASFWKKDSSFRFTSPGFSSAVKHLAVPLSPTSGGYSAVMIALPWG